MTNLRRIFLSDQTALAAADQLMKKAGIRLDPHLDYLCGIYEDSGTLIAVGGCYGNTLRCFAIDPEHQGEGLLPPLLTHLIDLQQERGNTELFSIPSRMPPVISVISASMRSPGPAIHSCLWKISRTDFPAASAACRMKPNGPCSSGPARRSRRVRLPPSS